MAGSRFVRADLHVHTVLEPSEVAQGTPLSVAGVIGAARARAISVLGVTDHNAVPNVREALAQAPPEMLVLPGIEVTTADGHLLGLFAPNAVDALEDFARPASLQLETLQDHSQRSRRSIVELTADIEQHGGIAIAAHVDSADGLITRANPATVRDLLVQPGLAAIEITRPESNTLFSAEDADPVRRSSWVERTKALTENPNLARVMSSDAHSPDQVGLDQPRRTLTRLRVDDLNFVAVRNALLYYPNARCKLEVDLAPNYPHLVSARFEGGFLDGLSLDFSPNLTCVIGGRGSGKSTILRAVQGALGCEIDPDEDNHPNMPDYTEVKLVDSLGTERLAGRNRNDTSFDVEDPDVRFRIPVRDLPQDVGREFMDENPENPVHTLEFLESFLDTSELDTQEVTLLTAIAENGDVIRRTARTDEELKKLRSDRAQLERSLATATNANLPQVAKYAQILAREGPLRDAIQAELVALGQASLPSPPNLIEEAARHEVDLTDRPIADLLPGEDGMSHRLAELADTVAKLEQAVRADLVKAATPVNAVIERWSRKHQEWEKRIEERRAQLQKEGLSLQVVALDKIRNRLQAIEKDVRRLEAWQKEYKQAWTNRSQLLGELRQLRGRKHELRSEASRRLAADLNRMSAGAQVSITWRREGMRLPWGEWLGRTFNLRSPRSERLAARITPAELAEIGWNDDGARLAAIGSPDEPFFADRTDEVMKQFRTYDILFDLDTRDVQDRPEIRVRYEADPPGPGRLLGQLSLGQSRSILVGFLLASADDSPLILDQPEDHLDGPFLAHTVVGYVHNAKERRQLVLATHSANLAVLGDADLVLPLEAFRGNAVVRDPGAVDNPATRTWILDLLEGGLEAFRKRGSRYGLKVEPVT